MKLGAVGSALVAERTPEAMQPENLFAAAQRLGFDHVELYSRDWDAPGSRFVERVGELQARTGIRAHLGFSDRYIEHGDAQPTERFAEFIERACGPLGVKIVGTVSHLHGGRWLKEPVPATFSIRMHGGGCSASSLADASTRPADATRP